MTTANASSPTMALAPASRRTGVLDRLARRVIRARLRGLDGGRVVINDADGRFGTAPGAGAADLAATVDVHRPRFYRRALLGGGLGAADAWIDGDWTCDDLTALLRIFVRNIDATDGFERGVAGAAAAVARLGHRFRRNTRRGSRRNIAAHYDLGNAFFGLWLDETMTYSCGVFRRPGATMAEASTEKLDLVCRKLELAPDDHVLEIGTGWGSFALHAAGRYGCRVTTTTISREQHALATRRVAEAGLDDRVTVLLSDYRDLAGRYDKAVSIEMIEAVGHENLDAYFGAITRLLADGGRMVLQAIVMPDERYRQYLRSADFIRTHVFPGSSLPSIGAMVASMQRTGDLRPVEVDDITQHYVTTLQRWRDRFEERREDVLALGFDERFMRLWHYYLCYCEAGFAERYIGDVQLLVERGDGR